jgi:hypothetical protein
MRRRGKPLTVYFTPEQVAQLDAVAKQRQISKSTLMRFAVDRLLEQLRGGQLDLPLGLE